MFFFTKFLESFTKRIKPEKKPDNPKDLTLYNLIQDKSVGTIGNPTTLKERLRNKLYNKAKNIVTQ
jgi:hypothetical protein